MPTLKLRNPLRRDPKRPTLKQRAAALKATAARLIRNPKNGPNADADLCALAGPWEAAARLYDQRLAEQTATDCAAMASPSHPGPRPESGTPAWDAWHRRWKQHCEQSGIFASEQASTSACWALGEIEDQIAALPARTLAGLQLKARVAERNSSVDVEWPEGLGDGLVADLLSLTGSLPAVPAAPQAAPSIGAETDPHLAYRDRLTVALVERWAAKPISNLSPNAPEAEIQSLVWQRLYDLVAEVFALPQPRTAQGLGVLAMAAAAQFEGAIGQPGAYRDERIAAGLIRGVLAMTGATLPPTFSGFGDEPDFKARDEAAFSGPYALPGWAITAATEA